MFLKEEHAEIELEEQYHWIWRAWNRLTDERHWQTRGIGAPMGGTIIQPIPTGIPWTAVHQWCKANNYTESEELLLDHCITCMDAVFVKWYIEQSEIKK